MITGKEQYKELALVKSQIEKAEPVVKHLQVVDDDSLKAAVNVRTKLYDLSKIIDVKKKSITDPINEALKAARSMFKPIEEKYEMLLRLCDGKILLYQKEQSDKAREAAAKIAARVEKGTLKPETAIAKMNAVQESEVKTTVKSDAGAIQFREIKKVVIFNPEIVPDKYWVLNEVLIRKEVLAGVEIPGVKIEIEKTIANH